MEICWPVFRLRNDKPTEHNGVIFYAYENYSEEDGETVVSNVVRIVDDTSIDNPKLSMRRLAIKSQGAKLYRLNRAVFFLGDLIKIAKKGLWFIDSNGKIFQYEKTTRCDLKFMKIVRVIPIDTGGAVIQVEGIYTRFKVLHYPPADKLYAGILIYGMSLILYGLYDQKYDDTWRMV